MRDSVVALLDGSITPDALDEDWSDWFPPVGCQVLRPAGTAAYRRAMTDRAGRAESRRAWRQLPYRTRRQVMRLSQRGELHPDEQVRALAASLAETWAVEFSPVRSVALACFGVAVVVVNSMLFRRVVGCNFTD